MKLLHIQAKIFSLEFVECWIGKDLVKIIKESLDLVIHLEVQYKDIHSNKPE